MYFALRAALRAFNFAPGEISGYFSVAADRKVIRPWVRQN
jgi:hypothetical protein